MSRTMMTDFYELTMAQTYFDCGKQDEIAYFDVFFRKNPFEGGYTISAGIDKIIEYINAFGFTEEEIGYLRGLGNFGGDFLEYLSRLKFTGDIFAIPDGTPVFPNEPVITVRAKIIEAQIMETALLACFNHGALAATAAKRIVEAAGGIPVMEFGARRARGIESAIEVSKYAYIGGCVGTSNTYAAMKYGIPALGTMAHSLVTDSESEYEAFLGYAKSNPGNCVFLVDTYDTLKSGVPNAIRVAREHGFALKGIRIDSGDLAYLSKKARKLLDGAGYPDVKICLSNGLDEYTITSLLAQGAKVDSIGVGDNISASKERVGGVYKLVAAEREGELIPRIKISNDPAKITTPCYKKVYRFYDKESGFAHGDVIALADEVIPPDGYTLIHPVQTWKRTYIEAYELRELQVPIFSGGRQLYKSPGIHETRDYCAREFETLYPEMKRLHNPHEYYVDLSESLLRVKNELIEKQSKMPRVDNK